MDTDSTQDSESPVLTAEEAAALLRVSTKTLLREARDGHVPGQKVGRSWRFSRVELLARLAAPQGVEA